MANNNRNQGDQSYDSNQDWDQNRGRYNDENYNQNRGGYGNMSNRANEEQNKGNERYGQQPGSKQNSGNQGGYEDMSHVEYGDVYRGNVQRREEETNRASGGRENIYNEWDKDEKRHGNQGGNYGRTREDYNRNTAASGGYYSGSENRGSDSNRGSGNRDWWDRTKDQVSSWFGDDDAERRKERDQRMSGEHKGKGPKGYKRSDERIKEDIHDRLYEDSHVDASDIEIQVENGEVVLTGNVSSRDQKRRAEDVVESVSGVNNVENRIRVGQRNNTSDNSSNRTTDESRSSNTGVDYTGTSSDVGSQTGTTNEVIRNSGNMRNNG